MIFYPFTTSPFARRVIDPGGSVPPGPSGRAAGHRQRADGVALD